MLDQPIRIYEETLAFQEAGAVMVEMKCVAAEIAAEITKRVDILVMSLGSGHLPQPSMSRRPEDDTRMRHAAVGQGDEVAVKHGSFVPTSPA
jgi:hypothetical protein